MIDFEKLNPSLSHPDYSVILYPIVEKNKRFQNGCLKIAFIDKSLAGFKKFEEINNEGLTSSINEYSTNSKSNQHQV